MQLCGVQFRVVVGSADQFECSRRRSSSRSLCLCTKRGYLCVLVSRGEPVALRWCCGGGRPRNAAGSATNMPRRGGVYIPGYEGTSAPWPCGLWSAFFVVCIVGFCRSLLCCADRPLGTLFPGILFLCSSFEAPVPAFNFCCVARRAVEVGASGVCMGGVLVSVLLMPDRWDGDMSVPGQPRL